LAGAILSEKAYEVKTQECEEKANIEIYTEFAGKNLGGTVFRLAYGSWTETVIQNFDLLAPNDTGSYPQRFDCRHSGKPLWLDVGRRFERL
jgi:hypothetical protein